MDGNNSTIPQPATRFVSCIRVDGNRLMPPVVTEEYRQELIQLKEKALLIERRNIERNGLMSAIFSGADYAEAPDNSFSLCVQSCEEILEDINHNTDVSDFLKHKDDDLLIQSTDCSEELSFDQSGFSFSQNLENLSFVNPMTSSEIMAKSLLLLENTNFNNYVPLTDLNSDAAGVCDILEIKDPCMLDNEVYVAEQLIKEQSDKEFYANLFDSKAGWITQPLDNDMPSPFLFGETCGKLYDTVKLEPEQIDEVSSHALHPSLSCSSVSTWSFNNNPYKVNDYPLKVRSFVDCETADYLACVKILTEAQLTYSSLELNRKDALSHPSNISCPTNDFNTQKHVSACLSPPAPTTEEEVMKLVPSSEFKSESKSYFMKPSSSSSEDTITTISIAKPIDNSEELLNTQRNTTDYFDTSSTSKISFESEIFSKTEESDRADKVVSNHQEANSSNVALSHADEEYLNELNTFQDQTSAPLVRSGSYTLIAPSPLLLAHVEAEKEKQKSSEKSDLDGSTDIDMDNVSESSAQLDFKFILENLNQKHKKQIKELLQTQKIEKQYVMQTFYDQHMKLTSDMNAKSVLKQKVGQYPSHIKEIREKQFGEMAYLEEPSESDIGNYVSLSPFVSTIEKDTSYTDLEDTADRKDVISYSELEDMTDTEGKEVSCSQDIMDLKRKENSWCKEEVIMDMKCKEKAATIINAGIRGYLVRRLMKTRYVQDTISLITYTVQFAMELQKEHSVEVHAADVELHGRLIQQLTSACICLHDTFFMRSIPEKMDMIATDRAMRSMSRTSSARSSLSVATQKSLQRKSMQANCQKTDSSPANSKKAVTSSPGILSIMTLPSDLNSKNRETEKVMGNTTEKVERKARKSRSTTRRPWH